MNPHQKNKVDISSLSPEEQRLFRLYGKLPNKKDLLQNKLKERKYFDSGDYALSKAGKASDVGVTSIGREHPLPENIPHATHSNLSSSQQNGASMVGVSGSSGAAGGGSAGTGNALSGSTPNLAPPGSAIGAHARGSLSSGVSGSPVKEASYLSRETSIDEGAGDDSAVADDEPLTAQTAHAATKLSPAAGNPSSGVREALPIRQDK